MEYQKIKERIVAEGTTTLLEYSVKKAGFISAIHREIETMTSDKI